MKKLFSTLPRFWINLALLLIMLLSTPIGYGLAQDTLVTIDPSDGEVAVGATTTVDIHINNVSDLYGAEVHLTFDAALLEVKDADQSTEGIQIQAGTFPNPYFTAQNTVDQAAGKIDFAISQGPSDDPVNGSGILATITFQGKASGSSVINFNEVLLANQNGESIDAGAQNGSIVIIDEASPTNTPTATTAPDDTPTPTLTPTTGPTLTPSPTPTTGPTSTPTPTPLTGDILGYHVVQPGETLFCIGRAYGVDPYAIASQNGILNPSIIHTGNSLAIPNAPRELPNGRVCPRQFNGDTPPSECRWNHTVVSGENLYRISIRYGVSMWAIAEANGITNLNFILAGQVLCIP